MATEKWLRKYGTGRAIVLARFVPFVRTLINPLCGIVKIPVRTFFVWNVIGGIIWTESVLFVGYILGEKLKGSVDSYILPIVGIIIFVSLIPVAIELFREWRTKRHLS
jgi:membrane-associated protein